ncbi:unnamed protein product, partial [Phaeothamnion confervicola]
MCHMLGDQSYDPLPLEDGVIFVTYASLIAKNARTSRLQQLVKWLKKDAGERGFEGCLLLDECHKAKNLFQGKSGGKPSKTGEWVAELQALLPNARVVYCSATACSEPLNMGYMSRLGLWGPETAYPEFEDFIDSVDRRGVGAMELVAMHLKGEGAMLSRTLSYSGCSFDLVEDGMSVLDEKRYNAAVKYWQGLWKVFQQVRASSAPSSSLSTGHRGGHASDDEARQEEERARRRRLRGRDEDGNFLFQRCGVDVKKVTKQVIITQFWAAHQRFFKSMCIALKVPAAVRLAKAALEEGKCVVLGLQSTGEANTLAA